MWKPSDFPGGVIDYPRIEKELLRLIVAFRISTMVFDQYNSIGTIQRLNASKGAEAPWEVEGSGGFGRGVFIRWRKSISALWRHPLDLPFD